MPQWQQTLCYARQTPRPSWRPYQGRGDLLPCLPPWALQGGWEAELLLRGNVVSPFMFSPSLFLLLLPTLLHHTGPGRLLRPCSAAQISGVCIFRLF